MQGGSSTKRNRFRSESFENRASDNYLKKKIMKTLIFIISLRVGRFAPFPFRRHQPWLRAKMDRKWSVFRLVTRAAVPGHRPNHRDTSVDVNNNNCTQLQMTRCTDVGTRSSETGAADRFINEEDDTMKLGRRADSTIRNKRILPLSLRYVIVKYHRYFIKYSEFRNLILILIRSELAWQDKKEDKSRRQKEIA